VVEVEDLKPIATLVVEDEEAAVHKFAVVSGG